MRRIALGVEYAGAELAGFQRQSSTPNTVQQGLELALSNVADEPITLVCAGRTDAGVHATGQVVHFDTLAPRPEKAWVLGTNTKLTDNIRVLWAKEVEPSFHARFSANYRSYRYIFHSGSVRSAVLGKQVTHISHSLNFVLMAEAARVLIGEHDFSSFRSSQCQAHSPVRAIHSIEWATQGALVAMQITANAFLHHMVRNIVGSLIEVGQERKSVSWLAEVLQTKDRRLAGATAPPWGLYLTKVGYPDHYQLPVHDPGPAFFNWKDHSSS